MPWHEGSIRVLGTQERCWTRAEQSRGISDGGGLGWRNGGRELQHKAGAGGGWAHSGKTSEQGSHSECKGAGAGEVRQVTPESQSRTERGDWHC